MKAPKRWNRWYLCLVLLALLPSIAIAAGAAEHANGRCLHIDHSIHGVCLLQEDEGLHHADHISLEDSNVEHLADVIAVVHVDHLHVEGLVAHEA